MALKLLLVGMASTLLAVPRTLRNEDMPPVVAAHSGHLALKPAPIKPEWILRGTPLARVCRFLRQLSRSHNNAKAFPLDMTQLELASVLDIHRVSLFRCLQQLRELGILVRFSRHEIELSELDQLEKLLEEQEEAEWG